MIAKAASWPMLDPNSKVHAVIRPSNTIPVVDNVGPLSRDRVQLWTDPSLLLSLDSAVIRAHKYSIHVHAEASYPVAPSAPESRRT